MCPTNVQAVEQLYRIQTDYRPSDAVRKQLQEKSLIMVIGAACEGKSTVIAEVVRQDPRFGIAGSFTTRDPRPDDIEKPYTYYPHTDDGLAQLFSRIGHRQVVSYAVHPFSKHIYGTELTDYPKAYSLLDTIATSVAGFREYGFNATEAVTIITTAEKWLARFNERFPEGHPQRAARRDEAIQSFSWSLEQTDTDHFWVDNSGDTPEKAAQTIIQIALGKSKGDPEARRLCEESLAAAQKMTA